VKNALASLMNVLRLPAEMTQFEDKYLARVNRIATYFYALHVPAFMLVAWANDTGPLMALVLTTVVLLGPVAAYKTFENPRNVSIVHGFTSMLMGGLLVHFGQGPVQIEMHFYFFALLAMLAIFANPMVILTAAATVAVHHLALWYYLPASVFNYDAPIWVVLVHAAFVVLESVATVYIARSFFDNVIGLERIVQARTAQLDDKNRQMRLVLDNVDQGLLTVGCDGIVADERAAVVDEWLGDCGGQQFSECLRRVDEKTADAFESQFDQLLMGILPFDVALDQFPTEMEFSGRHFGLDYTPIAHGDELRQLLVVLTDRTAVVQRERMEVEQRETMTLLERSRRDQVGFLEFFEEAKVLVHAITEGLCEDLALFKRTVHTLKGNSMLYDVQSIARICEHMEDEMAETQAAPNAELLGELTQRWERLKDSLRIVLDSGGREVVQVGPDKYRQLLEKALAQPTSRELAHMLLELKLEETSDRLERVGDQAKRIAQRLGKGDIGVEIEAGGLRLEPMRWAAFWQDFVHVVRNAVDHGLESREDREAQGKEGAGTLTLSTAVDRDCFIVRIQDNGRGIDWDRVRAKAAQNGIPHETRADLEQALFHDGLSTRDEASVYSGRGVGLAAVRSACEERGGQIKVHSKIGEGTTFEFCFPASEMVPTPHEFLAA